MLKKLLNKTRDIVNLYIRLKYARITSDGLMAVCYTCGNMWLLNDKTSKQNYHCSHLFREDQFASVRFNHNNLRPACKRCNRNLHGNLAIYTEKLIVEIGINEYEKLCYQKNQIKKWQPAELEQIIKEHKELLATPELTEKLNLYKRSI